MGTIKARFYVYKWHEQFPWITKCFQSCLQPWGFLPSISAILTNPGHHKEWCQLSWQFLHPSSKVKCHTHLDWCEDSRRSALHMFYKRSAWLGACWMCNNKGCPRPKEQWSDLLNQIKWEPLGTLANFWVGCVTGILKPFPYTRPCSAAFCHPNLD